VKTRNDSTRGRPLPWEVIGDDWPSMDRRGVDPIAGKVREGPFPRDKRSVDLESIKRSEDECPEGRRGPMVTGHLEGRGGELA